MIECNEQTPGPAEVTYTKTWYIDSRIGSHCGQFDVDLLVDFVNTGKALGWGELVLVTELSRGEVVVLSDGGMLSLTRHHQGGYPTVQEMFLQVRDNKLQFEKKNVV